MAPQLLTKREAAAHARISLRQLCRILQEGKGPTLTRIGGKVLIGEQHLAEWLTRCTASPAPRRPQRKAPVLDQDVAA